MTISNKIAFGAGCYWGTEKYFVKDFPKFVGKASSEIYEEDKILVGFMSPEGDKAMKNPTYRQVCSGTTGHVEVLDIVLKDDNDEDSLKDTIRKLIQFFFMFHDPTTMNQQGNDTGTQYASVIFVSDAAQEAIAKECINELQKSMDAKIVSAYKGSKISTAVVPYSDFYAAEADHQKYLQQNPLGYCNHRFRFREWPAAGK